MAEGLVFQLLGLFGATVTHLATINEVFFFPIRSYLYLPEMNIFRVQ